MFDDSESKNLNWRGKQINNRVFRQYSMYTKEDILHTHKKTIAAYIRYYILYTGTIVSTKVLCV